MNNIGQWRSFAMFCILKSFKEQEVIELLEGLFVIERIVILIEGNFEYFEKIIFYSTQISWLYFSFEVKIKDNLLLFLFFQFFWKCFLYFRKTNSGITKLFASE